MANSFLSSFYQSTDNTKLLFRVGNITSGINILAIIIGILLGDIENIAQMLVVSFSLVLVISLVYLKKLLDFTVKEYISIILKNILIIFPYIILEQFIFDFHFGSFYNIVASGVMLFTIWSFGMLLTKEYKNFINFSK